MLHPRKKISKREIKEEALVTYFNKIQNFYTRYSKQLQIGILAVAIILVLVFMMSRSKKRAEIAAAGKLGVVEQNYYQGDFQRVIPELITIQKNFSGTPSAGRAVFFLANSYFWTGNFTEAEKWYRQYVDQYGQRPDITAASLAGLGSCLEAQKQYSKAAEQYEKAGSEYGDLFTAPFYLKDAGRCYALAGNKTKGKTVYQLILKKYPDSSPAQDAELMAETL